MKITRVYQGMDCSDVLSASEIKAIKCNVITNKYETVFTTKDTEYRIKILTSDPDQSRNEGKATIKNSYTGKRKDCFFQYLATWD